MSEGAPHMTKQQFMDLLSTGWNEWQALLASVPRRRMTAPGAAGEWSVKDVIAHVTWGEREMVGMLRQRALVGSPYWTLPQTDRNAAVYAENRDRPLDDALAESLEVHAQLVAELEKVTDGDLNDASRFAEMPAAWLPWRVIAGNCFEHYQEHTPGLRAWLQGMDVSGDS
jgi:uncharacterized protein (TIGR03083 family)